MVKIDYGKKWHKKPTGIEQHNYYQGREIRFYPLYESDIMDTIKTFCVAIWKIKYKKISFLQGVKRLFYSLLIKKW